MLGVLDYLQDMTETTQKKPGVFEPGDEVFTQQANRHYHGVVEALGPERYEVQVRTDQGELLTVHSYNVRHASLELTLADYAAVADELAQVPGSAHEQERHWRETTDLEHFAKLETAIILGEETADEKAEYERLLASHPGQARLQAELVPALRKLRAERGICA